MTNILTLDCETSIKNKGNPFTKSNKLCLVGLEDKDGYTEYDIENSGNPYGDHLRDIAYRIGNADLVVGFNLKFDLHWLRRYIPDVRIRRVYDCQLAEFVLGHQMCPYPSLGQVSYDRGLGSKLDVVRLEYWENGIDTPDIPRDILSEYLRQDVELTKRLFEVQRKLFHPLQRQLLILQFEDLLVLEEMEFNGMLYDKTRAAVLGKETKEAVEDIDLRLRELSGNVSINFNSDDHVSALLYGGDVVVPVREYYIRILKDGTEKQRERWGERVETFPQLVKPIRGSETKPTHGMGDQEIIDANRERSAAGKAIYRRRWSVAEPILRQLKPTKKATRIIELMLERSRLAKLDSTYYSGLLSKFQELEWEGDVLHGQFNQCVARTGRLSSSNPNLQNFSGEIKELFYSRVV